MARFSFAQTPKHRVTYTYAADSRTYTYSSEAGTEIDAGNGRQPVRVTSAVVVQVAHHDAGYVEDVNSQHGIDFDFPAEAPADVYTRGVHLPARFLLGAGRPPQLVAADGSPLNLPEGLTWIHLIDPGTPIGP